MPPSPLNLTNSPPPTRGNPDQDLDAKASRTATNNTASHGHDEIVQDKGNHRSPTSPRALKGSSKAEKQERRPSPRRDGSNSDISAADLSKPGLHIYGASSNNSTSNMSNGNPFDETASTKSAASAVPESVRSDDELNRNTSSSSFNVTERATQRKSSKGALPNMLQRNHSKRQPEARDRGYRLRLEQPPADLPIRGRERQESNPLTAPPGRQEHHYREAMQASQYRNRSADQSAVESEDEMSQNPHKTHLSQNSFLSNFRSHGAKAADGIGKASKGFFGKLKESRSGSNDKDHHPQWAPTGPFEVLRLPLKEQTRKTRIRKSMDVARDKTEFWMPALPYRCIDFLNHCGIESEGLYRIPGSTAEIKQLQSKFNRPPYDLDLLETENTPNDLNAVASMLKAWVRELPEKLLPDDVQSRIQEKAANETSTPQVMRDELSRLPPYNYYLLFAITCHMSLLHAHQDVNKMNYGALRTCWASLRVDAYIFGFLICDWRNCWQGCWTEQEHMKTEQEIFDGEKRASPPPENRPITGFVPTPLRYEPSSSAQSSTHQSHAQSPEHAPPSAPPNAATSSHDPVQPFAQDLGRRQAFSPPPKRISTPPPNVGPIQNVSPMQM